MESRHIGTGSSSRSIVRGIWQDSEAKEKRGEQAHLSTVRPGVYISPEAPGANSPLPLCMCPLTRLRPENPEAASHSGPRGWRSGAARLDDPFALGRWLPMAPGVLRFCEVAALDSKEPRFRLLRVLASTFASFELWLAALPEEFDVRDGVARELV